MRARRRRCSSLRPGSTAIESLESRRLLTAYTVTTLADSIALDGKISLREAIQAANANATVNEAGAGQSNVIDTITFSASLAGGTITLGGTQLDITGDLRITGLGSPSLAISANGQSRIFQIGAGVSADVRALTLKSGNAGSGSGGAINNMGSLVLVNVVVTGNRAFDAGGVYNGVSGLLTITRGVVSNNAASTGAGITTYGTLQVINTTISGNAAMNLGGGIWAETGVTNILGSTLSGNSAVNGGGIFNHDDSALTIINSTLSGNSANGTGGGVYVTSNRSTLVLRNATVFGNRADADGNGSGGGGGLYTANGTTTAYNSIIAGNVRGAGVLTQPSDYAGIAGAGSSYNVIGDDAGASGYSPGTNHNFVNIDWTTLIDPVLKNNGGVTKTHGLLNGSLAIDAGNNALAIDAQGNSLTTDQRGAGFARLVGAAVDIGSYEVEGPPSSVVVDMLLDEDDGNDAPGDVSLREALQIVSVGGVVTFSTAIAGGTINLTLGELAIENDVTIIGLGSAATFISGSNASRVFNISNAATVTIRSLSIVDGNAASGAGILNAGHLTLSDAVVRGNAATGGGGSIANSGTLSLEACLVSENTDPTNGGGVLNTGVLSISASTLSGNEAGGNGGAVANAPGASLAILNSTLSGNTSSNGGGISNAGTLTISNSTLSGNMALGSGGGIYISEDDPMNATVATILQSTLYGNRADADANTAGAGGGVFINSGTLVAHNAIVIGNVSGLGTPDDVTGTLAASSSFNLVGDTVNAGGLADGENGNIVGASAGSVLDPVLRDNGGLTRSHALRFGSVAINRGNDSLALDADGNPLMTDQRMGGFLRSRQGRVDIGAVEWAGADDLVGFNHGEWRVGVSNATSFDSSTWAAWKDVPWSALRQGDFNGDGRIDVLGLIHGQWWVGLSNGTGFVTSLWTRWKDLDWEDVVVGDLDADGKDDVAARIGRSWWGMLSTGTGFGTANRWATYVDGESQYVGLIDVNMDDRADLLTFRNGIWSVLASAGTVFTAPRAWALWANVPWDAVGTCDANGDGRTDVYGLLNGAWYVGLAKGSAFVTGLRTRWAQVAWQDALSGDFNGDGRDDLAARIGGSWWVSFSTQTGGGGVTRLWAAWSNQQWKDARVGDFDGDGRDDIAARVGGGWYIARQIGSAVSTSRWALWANADWNAVAAADATGPLDVPAPEPVTGAVMQQASLASDEDSFALIWSADEEDALLNNLLAAS